MLQNKDGTKAGSVVASELAAMFICAVFPTIRKHYGSGAEYDEACKRFAAQMGHPAEWCWLYVPAPVTLDWDTCHHRPRSLLALDRWLPHDDAYRFFDAAQQQVLGASCPERYRDRGGEGLQPAEWLRDTNEDNWCDLELYKLLLEQAVRINRQAGYDVVWARLRTRQPGMSDAEWEVWQHSKLCRVLPWQFMPLEKVCPDINTPAEHDVRTVHAGLQARTAACDNYDELLKGATYMQWTRRIVQRKLCGEEGRQHIEGSIQRQHALLQILAGNEGTTVVVRDRDGELREADCTAGQWITDSRFAA